MEIKVLPDYISINFVADICEPWIELWSGDEWGESMQSLHSACHTSYGFDDDDCAVLAAVLLKNLIWMYEWIQDEGYSYGLWEIEDVERVQKRCRELKDYWLNGGNFTGNQASKDTAAETLKIIPSWVFGG